MKFQTRLFIGGEFVDAEERGRIEVLNPHDNSRLCEVAEAGPADIDQAVEAAARAFPAWRARPAAERGRLLLRLADLTEAHLEELAQIESLDTGHPIRDWMYRARPRPSATSAAWPIRSKERLCRSSTVFSTTSCASRLV